jgi:hypothetical protein
MTITPPVETTQSARRVRSATAGVRAEPSAGSATGGRRRTLVGYLVVPRPKDLVKALLMPLAFALGVLGNGGTDARTVLRAAVVLLALELLIYPARYQWNDVRGFVSDQRHPAEAERGRLPGPLGRARAHVVASCVTAAARLAVTAALALLPGLHAGGVLLFATVGVFGVAVAYEALRATATGRTSEMPPPLSPSLVLLWITVGAGYVVRGLTGLALAVDLQRRPALGVAAAVLFWSYGMAFVTSRWAIEATAFGRLYGDRVVWAADAGHAREHLLGLVRWLPSRVDREDLNRPGDGSPECWAALRCRTPVLAPWNLALILAGAAAALTGRLLTGPAGLVDASAVAVIGGLASLVTVLTARVRPAVAAAGGAVLIISLALLRAPAPVTALLPWLAVTGAYLHFSAQSLGTMGRLGGELRAWLCRLLAPVARLVVGRETWDVVARG